MTVHDQLRSLLLSVRRRWRAEVVAARGRPGGRVRRRAAAPRRRCGCLAGARRCGADGAERHDLPGRADHCSRTAWRLGRTPGDGHLARFVPDDRQVARFIEERAARRGDVVPFDDVVVSAVEALSRLEPEPFRGLVVESAVRRLEAIGAGGIVTTRALRRAGAEALAGVAALAVATALAWPMLARASETAWIAVFPESLQVEVLPGDTRVPTGQPLTIRASVRAGGTAAHAFHAPIDR